MAKEKLKENLEKLGNLLITHPGQDNEALKKESITGFLQLSKDERIDFLSFIQRFIIVANISEDSPKYPLKNILILSMIDFSSDIISPERQLEYLKLLLTNNDINQDLIAGFNTTPLARAILRGHLSPIKFLVEDKKAQPAYVFTLLCYLIRVNFSFLSSEERVEKQELEKLGNNFQCYNYILQKINLFSIEAKGAATIITQLSEIIKYIEAKKDRGSREAIEQLIGDLRKSQNYIENQLFKIRDGNIKPLKEVHNIRNAILNLFNLNDGFFSRLDLTILLGDIGRFKQYIQIFDHDKSKLLVYACKVGNSKVVKYLVELGVDINLASQDGSTPLMVACERKNVEITQILLKTGKVAPDGCAKALEVAGDPAIEALLTQCLTHDTASIKMEDTELNQNFTSNLVLRAGSSLAALHR
jgi:hypothetical protein